jgi:hypothetical protein
MLTQRGLAFSSLPSFKTVLTFFPVAKPPPHSPHLTSESAKGEATAKEPYETAPLTLVQIANINSWRSFRTHHDSKPLPTPLEAFSNTI